MIVSRTLVRVLCLAVSAAAAAGIAAAPRAHAAAGASFTVVANQTAANGGQNFNGVAKGRLTITVAPGTPVHVKFVNDKTAALPHSFQVIPLKGSAQAPVTTSASIPTRLAAIAKCDDERASQIRPVRGLNATTANLADVVSGLPTSGLSAKTRAASAPRGSTPADVS